MPRRAARANADPRRRVCARAPRRAPPWRVRARSRARRAAASAPQTPVRKSTLPKQHRAERPRRTACSARRPRRTGGCAAAPGPRPAPGDAASAGTTGQQRGGAKKPPSTRAIAQPQSGPWTMRPTSAPMPAASSSAPSDVGARRVEGSRRSRRTRAPNTSAVRPTGTLTRKTQRQSASHEQAADRRARRRRRRRRPRPSRRRRPSARCGGNSRQQQRQGGRQHQRARRRPAATRVATSGSTDRGGRAAGAAPAVKSAEPGRNTRLRP